MCLGVIAKHYADVLSGLTAATLIFGLVRAMLFIYVLVKSTETLHKRMFNAILHTPVHFFDVNPIGRRSLFLLKSEWSHSCLDVYQTFKRVCFDNGKPLLIIMIMLLNIYTKYIFPKPYVFMYACRCMQVININILGNILVIQSTFASVKYKTNPSIKKKKKAGGMTFF